ncbi:D-alanyl-D-alanine carboxypeptidase family protein [Flavobacteriaceae bacterium M23B6Z8]
MTAQAYCELVEAKDIEHKRLATSISIQDNHSPLVSLMDTGFNLIFEPSILEDYQFLVRKKIIKKISSISKKLEKQDKILIVRSAWRSFEHQKLLWDSKFAQYQQQNPDKSNHEINEIINYFIAPPGKSMHHTGGSVDALIYDKREQRVMDFGTNNGLEIDLSKKCYPYHPDISDVAKKNRSLLINLFEDHDFTCDLKEYWHFDYGNVTWAIKQERQYAIYGNHP